MMAQNVLPNYRSKRALIKALQEGMEVRTFDTEVASPVREGEVEVEGPHWPELRQWNAQVWVANGRVTRVLR